MSSILDDENILIENVGDSCNLVKPLEEMLERFNITNTINILKSEKCEEIFNKLSCLNIDGYEWLRYFDMIVLYNKEAASTVFVIFFEKAPQYCTGNFYCEHKIRLNICIHDYDLTEELSSNLRSLFDLNNNQIWEIASNFDHPYPPITYKYIKK